MKKLIFILLVFLCHHLPSQDLRVEPPFWWAGMQNPALELLVHHENIANAQASIDYEGVDLVYVTSLESRNYLFLGLQLDPGVEPGKFDIVFRNGRKEVARYTYELKARIPGSASRQGFNNSDVIYLITPDRFANGDPSNDEIDGMKEGINRSDDYGRHGGDIEGIRQHLDYLADLGFTGVWVNPILENDMASASYHGYSTTDFYKVDPRFGTNESYVGLSAEMKQRNIKRIMDMIVNHCGSEHWWMKDPPSSDWLNFNNTFVQTNHRKQVIQDPYASAYDYKRLVDGWFVRSMPDLNQRNPHMARYLIQNSIWWVEYADLNGIRMDTWPYSDKYFLRDWSCAIMTEYPEFNITGEEWHGNPNILAYWQKGKINQDGYETCLPGLLDFPLQIGLNQGLTEDNGLKHMYEMLGNDFIYADPSKFVIFPDNHDMDRIYTQLGEDRSKFRNAMAYILTMRGTPQLYYGTELLFTNQKRGDHGEIRKDYPGGWQGDAVNAFTSTGLSEDQVEARDFIRKINLWRKDAHVIHEGRVKHFAPFDNIYVFFRLIDDGMVMTVMNRNLQDREIDISRLSEVLGNRTSGKDILTGTMVTLNGTMSVKAGEPMIIELD